MLSRGLGAYRSRTDWRITALLACDVLMFLNLFEVCCYFVDLFIGGHLFGCGRPGNRRNSRGPDAELCQRGEGQGDPQHPRSPLCLTQVDNVCPCTATQIRLCPSKSKVRQSCRDTNTCQEAMRVIRSILGLTDGAWRAHVCTGPHGQGASDALVQVPVGNVPLRAGHPAQ